LLYTSKTHHKGTYKDHAKAALQMGGNIRIGFENNILLPDGSPAKDNEQTVALAAALIKDMAHV